MADPDRPAFKNLPTASLERRTGRLGTQLAGNPELTFADRSRVLTPCPTRDNIGPQLGAWR